MPFKVDPTQQTAYAPSDQPLVTPPTNPNAPNMGPFPATGAAALGGLDPTYQNMVTQGPDGQQWGGRQMLDRDSAERMAKMLGGTLAEVNYDSGPFKTNVPQYQIDFGTGNLHDATLLYEQYLRAPSLQQFQNQMRDELASDRGGGPVGLGSQPGPRVAGAGGTGSPSPSYRPPAGGGFGGGSGPQLPPQPTGPQTSPYTGPAVRRPGSYTVPPLYSMDFPAPIDMTPDGIGLPNFVRPPQGLLTIPTGSPTAGLLQYLNGGSR